LDRLKASIVAIPMRCAPREGRERRDSPRPGNGIGTGAGLTITVTSSYAVNALSSAVRRNT